MIIKCKMCGGDLAFTEGSTVCECEFCGSMQTLPNVDNEKKANLFNRANRLRMNNEFDKASAVYESIVAEFPEEAEAYWGLCLCAYGIEYVDDPGTGKKLPTCHRTLPASIMEDSNFEQACDYADSVARRVYRDEAKVIDRIQKDILSIAATESPYDVFICYKETAEEGDRTEDSVLAQDIYDALTAKGMKVFFSRITLEDKLGVQYEPYIFAALSSAKVMLAIGTQFEYYDAVWVKNEWSRFLGMMKTDRTKTLIPCFKGLDAYDMPKEFKGLQAQDMGKLGWMQDLVRGVEKLCGKEQAVSATVQQVIVTQNGNSVENLMQRVYMFLEDRNSKQAREYIDKVLDIDAQYAPAYVAKVMAHLMLKHESDLSTLRKSLDGNSDWEKALRFATPDYRVKLDEYARNISENISADQDTAAKALEESKNAKYQSAMKAAQCNDYVTACALFCQLGDYLDSQEQANACSASYSKTVEQKLFEEKATLENSIETQRADLAQVKKDAEQIRGLFNGDKKRKANVQISSMTYQLWLTEQKLEAIKESYDRRKAHANDNAFLTADLVHESVIKQYRQIRGIVKLGKWGSGQRKHNPIEWVVLEAQGDRTLLISREGLSQRKYYDSLKGASWSKSELRQWLNEEFLKGAFTVEERKAILPVSLDNSESWGEGYKSHGGEDTQDHVFLLSHLDAAHYFDGHDDPSMNKIIRYVFKDPMAQMKPAFYAKEIGEQEYAWWLRSLSATDGAALCVQSNGEMEARLTMYHAYVRPVILVDLTKL